MRSLSLYTSLGFDVTASCVVMSGKPRSGPVDGVEVRPLAEDDLDECEALCKKVHGFARTGALRDALAGVRAVRGACATGGSSPTRRRSRSGRWRTASPRPRTT